MKRKLKKVLVSLLVVALFASATDIHVFAEEYNVTETSQESVIADSVSDGDIKRVESVQNNWDGITTESVYETENYRVTFVLTGHWDGGFNANVKIENISDCAIENWYLGFDYNNAISNIWNAEIYSTENGKYVVKNVGWNQNIAVDNSVEFGFSGNENFSGFPREYEIIGETAEKSQEDYTVEYRLDRDWESGFTGTIMITNNTDETIEDWRIKFSFNRTITHIWNGEIEDQSENIYIIKNAGYNSNIAPGQTVSFGFNGESGNKDVEPEKYILYSCGQKNVSAFTITFHADDEDVKDVPAAQTVLAGECAVKPENPSRAGYLFLGWYTDEIFTECFDFCNTPIKNNLDLYARWFDYECSTDTDGDGLVDSLEDLIGSSITNTDSDEDGLSDFIEVDKLYTSPILCDTDGNGVSDGDEDFDGDGLSNKEEISLGTDPMAKDTDNDKLSDYEEQKVHGTDPLVVDTDEDGVSDGKEIELGTDPLVYQSSFQVSVLSKHDGPVKASVDIELEGRQVETLTIEAVKNETLFPEAIPGYIGEAYDFCVDGTFDTATIHFEFPEEFLDIEGFDPTVYYFNEEEQQLEALPTTVSSNIASAETTHFSTYILINRKIFEDEYNERNKWIDVLDTTSYTGVEVVFVIDDSGSMVTSDKTNLRLEVAKDLIDNLPANSKVGIIRFTSTTSILTTTLTADRTVAKSYLNKKYFLSSGNTYMYNAINKGFSLFESKDNNILKMMVVLSDGDSSDTAQHSTVVDTANENKVRIYTVGLGSSTTYFTNYLKPLANNTEGKFYLASNASKLAEIYENIRERIDLETDSDLDGIADYYEDHLLLFNGVSIKTNKNNPDSDEDGLWDGQEIELRYEYNSDRTQVRVTGKVKYNPLSKDSDGDGLYDNASRVVKGRVVAPVDPDPLHGNGPAGLWKTHVEKQETETVATQYSNDLGLDMDALIDTMRQRGMDIPENEYIAESIVKLAVELREPVNDNAQSLRTVAQFLKWNFSGSVETIVGAFLLNFVRDKDLVAYHSQVKTWQRYFGYNDFYDEVFRIGSPMHNFPYAFNVGSEKYQLWLWKGDYWALHSGAEMGLYVFSDTYSGIEHFDAIDFEVPMTLSLYNYDKENKIDNIFNWAPEEEQWWITGFSGLNWQYLTPNPDNMVMVGSINLSARNDMYEALKNTYTESSNLDCIFDDQTHTVWINWYEGVK